MINKCTQTFYSLTLCGSKSTETQLDIDLLAVTLNKVLLEASAASAPKKKKISTSKEKKKPFIWNDTVAVAAKRSKDAHMDWKDAGCPHDNLHPLFISKKQARQCGSRSIWIHRTDSMTSC